VPRRKRSWRRFERRTDKLAPLSVYVQRIIAAVAIAILLMLVALSVGMAGYHLIAGFDFVDSLLEASMILGGMGPVRELPNQSAKIFASIYALFSGVFFIALMGIILAPVAHRVLHKFHLDGKDVE
jgi:ABC-type transport system involved in cytochrome bd biosynthesis fused ATPase/permease subunit